MTAESNLRCSFCGKPVGEVWHLIAGPSAFICDECVSLCAEILDERRMPARSFQSAMDCALAGWAA